jgi:carboxyl-terminal processing protease
MLRFKARATIWLALFSIGVSLAPLCADETDTAKAAAASQPEADAAAKKAAEELELLKLFADTLDQVERNYVQEVDRRELMEAAIRGMLSKLDPYSNYIPPQELDRFKSSVENEYGGVGITVSLETGKLAVVSPVLGSPAYRAGLRGGDRIVEIEGHSTDGITMDEAVRQMKGKIGTAVKVAIEPAAGGERRAVEMTRELIKADSVLGDRRKPDDTWNYLLDEEKKIGYVRITTFGRHTADDLRSALIELTQAGMQGLILDLRFNGGGLLTTGIEVADLLVAEGRIVSTAGRNAPQRIWDAKPEGTFGGFSMVVLVNRTTASASEIVAACLQDHKLAKVVGERTWGKGSVQNIVELDSGRSALKLTTAGYVRPSGKNIHRLEGAKEEEDWGVRPDAGLEVPLTADEREAYLLDRRKRDAIVAPPKEGETTAAQEFKFDKQLQAAYDELVRQLAEKSATASAEAK